MTIDVRYSNNSIRLASLAATSRSGDALLIHKFTLLRLNDRRHCDRVDRQRVKLFLRKHALETISLKCRCSRQLPLIGKSEFASN